MASDAKKIYLGRKGKVFGPFSQPELESFRLSGEISYYRYIWDDASESWSPLEPPPKVSEGDAEERG